MLVNFPFRIGQERVEIISEVMNVIKKDKFFGIGVKFIKIDKLVLSELHAFIDEIKRKNNLE